MPAPGEPRIPPRPYRHHHSRRLDRLDGAADELALAALALRNANRFLPDELPLGGAVACVLYAAGHVERERQRLLLEVGL